MKTPITLKQLSRDGNIITKDASLIHRIEEHRKNPEKCVIYFDAYTNSLSDDKGIRQEYVYVDGTLEDIVSEVQQITGRRMIGFQTLKTALPATYVPADLPELPSHLMFFFVDDIGAVSPHKADPENLTFIRHNVAVRNLKGDLVATKYTLWCNHAQVVEKIS